MIGKVKADSENLEIFVDDDDAKDNDDDY